ncbi:MAG: hypothetical protein WKF43_17160 [Acidimicrobiales bacterium]
MRCDDLADVLAAVPDATGRIDPPSLDTLSRRHVEQCLRCQADLVQYRRLLTALRSLRSEVLEPAPGLVGEILTLVEAAGERTAVRALLGGRRAAYLGGLAAATAAGAAAGAIVLATRSRRGRLPLAG